MIFDTLRRIGRTWLPDIRPIIEAAHVIHLPIAPHRVLPRHQPLKTLSRISTQFTLPHPVTAIEDNASCVVLVDPSPGLRGLDERRLFFDCVPLDGRDDAYGDGAVFQILSQAAGLSRPAGVNAVTAGWIACPAQREGQWLASGELIWAVTGTADRQHATNADFQRLPPALSTLIAEQAMRNAMVGVEELIYFSEQISGPTHRT
jgi:hypothetical protein